MSTWKKLLHTGNVIDTDLDDGTGGTSGKILAIASDNEALEWITAPTTGVGSIATDAGLDGSGSSGTVTISLQLNELTDMDNTALAANADKMLVIDASDNNDLYKIKTLNTIGLNAFDNDAGYTTNVGDITNVGAGTGLSGGGASGSVTLNVDFSELTDMTGVDVDGDEDEMVLMDNTVEKRKLLSEIKLSEFNNDLGWTDNAGDITGVSFTTDDTQSVTDNVNAANFTLAGGTGVTTSSSGSTMTVALALTELTTQDIGTASNTLAFLGNISVAGTTTLNGTVTMNSSTVTTTDKIVEVADGSANATAAAGAGIEVDTGSSGSAQKPGVIWSGDTDYGMGWTLQHGYATGNYNQDAIAAMTNHVMSFREYDGAPGNAAAKGEGCMIWDYTNENMYICTAE